MGIILMHILRLISSPSFCQTFLCRWARVSITLTILPFQDNSQKTIILNMFKMGYCDKYIVIGVCGYMVIHISLLDKCFTASYFSILYYCFKLIFLCYRKFGCIVFTKYVNAWLEVSRICCETERVIFKSKFVLLLISFMFFQTLLLVIKKLKISHTLFLSCVTIAFVQVIFYQPWFRTYLNLYLCHYFLSIQSLCSILCYTLSDFISHIPLIENEMWVSVARVLSLKIFDLMLLRFAMRVP